MTTKKILSWISLFLGEILIIAAFILFRGNMPNNILVLNIVVASLIYGLFFMDMLIAWTHSGEKSDHRIGAMGVRWMFTWMYAILAIAVMIISNVWLSIAFASQLVAQGVAVFLLLLGFIAAIRSSEKIKEVFVQQKDSRNGLIEMKKAISNLKDRMNTFSDLPEYFITRINTLEENMRYISPANNQEAYALESSFASTINDIAFATSNFSMNEEAIESNLKKCERIYQNRKQIHSI